MFYMKHKGKRLKIQENNVYTICPVCGREHMVDIQEILSTRDADLYGTAVYCEDCTDKRAMKGENNV